MKCHGLLLAAGRGRRMGGNKQFHLVQTSTGEKPLVAAAFDTIAGVCASMFVVLGHRAEEVAGALGDREFETVIVDPDAPMFNSIQAGLRAALKNPPPRYPGEGLCILLQLGDHPAVDESTLEKLFTVATENPDKAVMPSYQDNGGHPVLIPSAIAEKILATPCPDGLRQFWLEHAELCVRIEIDDPSVIHDIDNP
jgi:molybdenum cofactor cytidylyltransferase